MSFFRGDAAIVDFFLRSLFVILERLKYLCGTGQMRPFGLDAKGADCTRAPVALALIN